MQTRDLRAVVATLFLACFGLFPASILLFGMRRELLAALPSVLLLSVCCALLYWRSASLLCPCTSRLQLCGNISTLVLYPVSALRCMDLLSRDILLGFDPVAVAAALCGKEEAARLAAVEVAVLNYAVSAPESDPSRRTARLEVLEWF